MFSWFAKMYVKRTKDFPERKTKRNKGGIDYLSFLIVRTPSS